MCQRQITWGQTCSQTLKLRSRHDHQTGAVSRREREVGHPVAREARFNMLHVIFDFAVYSKLPAGLDTLKYER